MLHSYSKSVVSRFGGLATLSLLLLVGTPCLQAQGAGAPSFSGQWSGPYTLTNILGGNKEIAHAIVLPPAEGKDSRVFFIARKATCGTGNVDGFVWLGNRPGNAQRVTHSSSPLNASEDAFCSGHTLLPDGNVLIAGGLDEVGKCESACNPDQSAFGHRALRVLDTSTHPPTWIEPSLLTMNRERWYPSLITLNNGDPFIAGHGKNAEPDGPDQCAPTYGAEAIHETWDRIAWNPLALVNPTLTISRGGVNCDTTDPFLSMGDYPRIHMLSTGDVFIADATRAAFLDIENPLCGVGQEERWETMPTSMPSVDRHGGNSVHLVYPDPGQPGMYAPIDVIYAIGGTNGGDDTTCVPLLPDDITVASVYGEVDKYVEPSVSTVWDYSAPDLNFPRFNHNSVLLLDGSILVNGGSDGVSCAGDPLPPERYRPPEIFGPSQGSSWTAVTGAVEPSHRRYHSVAGLLPDGRVFSAGGTFTADYHTVAVYEPPYFFRARPEITSSPAVIQYPQVNGTFPVNVTLSSASSTVERVALVRTGSITHAWDMNQRYVVLDFDVVGGTSPQLTLDVQLPTNAFAVPPGHYYLTVVEKTQMLGEGKWVPSPGQWIRVDL